MATIETMVFSSLDVSSLDRSCQKDSERDKCCAKFHVEYVSEDWSLAKWSSMRSREL